MIEKQYKVKMKLVQPNVADVVNFGRTAELVETDKTLDIEATLDVIIAHLNKEAEALAARDKIKEILK